jgi:hypothetical protein
MRRCAGKARHEEREGAEGQRAGLVQRYGLTRGRMDVYRCDQCLGWHVGGANNVFITRRRSGKRANKRMRGR